MTQLALFPDPPPRQFLVSRRVVRWVPKVERDLEVVEWLTDIRGWGIYRWTPLRDLALAVTMSEVEYYELDCVGGTVLKVIVEEVEGAWNEDRHNRSARLSPRK